MKWILFFIVALHAIACTSTKATKGNLKTIPITIDFSNSTATVLKKKAPVGSLIELQITNLNRNQYSAEVNNSQLNFFAAQPEIFSRLQVPNLAVTEQSLDKETAGSSFSAPLPGALFSEEINAINKKQQEFSKHIDDFKKELEIFKKAVSVLKDGLGIKAILATLSQDCSSNINSIIAAADAEVKSFCKKDSTVLPNAVSDNHSVLKSQVKIILEHYFTEASDSYKNLSALDDKINTTAPELSASVLQLTEKVKVKLADRTLASAAREDLTGKVLILDKINRTANTDKANQASIMKSVSTANNFVQTFQSNNEVSSLLGLYGSFTQEHYILKTSEILEKDELLFDVSIQPKSTATCPSTRLHLPIRVRSVGGFKIDFSSGLFLNFGGREFFNQTYRLEDFDADNYTIVKNKNRNALIPSLGALLHGYIRTGGDLQPAVSIGVSLSAGENSRLNYHFAPSLIIGKEQRFIISIGGTLSQSSILDGKYTVGQKIPKATAPQTLETTLYYRWGYFFSVNYNITR